MPGGEHKSQLPRGSHDQQLQLSQRLIRAQFVHIIDDQPDRVRQRGQVRQQPLDDRPPVQIWRRGHGLHQHRPRGRLTQRIQHRQPEPLRVSHTAADRHPRNTARQPQLATPRAKQHRLAAARRSRHHRHPARRREPKSLGRATIPRAPAPAASANAAAGSMSAIIARRVPSVSVWRAASGTARSGLDVLQVFQEARVCRLPAERLACAGTGGGLVGVEDRAEGAVGSCGTASTGTSSRLPMTAAMSRTASPAQPG
jgi:hypothetical protein